MVPVLPCMALGISRVPCGFRGGIAQRYKAAEQFLPGQKTRLRIDLIGFLGHRRTLSGNSGRGILSYNWRLASGPLNARIFEPLQLSRGRMGKAEKHGAAAGGVEGGGRSLAEDGGLIGVGNHQPAILWNQR